MAAVPRSELRADLVVEQAPPALVGEVAGDYREQRGQELDG